MVQTYGVAPVNDSEPTDQAGSEDSALLGGDATAKKVGRDGNATMISCISNLANTIIGSGELTLRLCHAVVVLILSKGC